MDLDQQANKTHLSLAGVRTTWYRLMWWRSRKLVIIAVASDLQSESRPLPVKII